MVHRCTLSASFSGIGKFLNYTIFFVVGQSDKGKSDIFDKDEVSSPFRPFPPKSGIPREIHFAPSEKRQCSAAP